MLLEELDVDDGAPIFLDSRTRPVHGARYVNTCFLGDDDDTPLPRTRCLAAGRRHRLRSTSAPGHPRTLWTTRSSSRRTRSPRAPGYWLAAAVTSDDFIVDPRERSISCPPRACPAWSWPAPPRPERGPGTDSGKLIPLTSNEIRRLFTKFALTAKHVWHWSCYRRRGQQQARACHYRKRLEPP